MEAAREINGTLEVVDGVWYKGLLQREIFNLDSLRLRSATESPYRVVPASGAPMWTKDLEYLSDIYDGSVRYADAMFGWLMDIQEPR